MASRPEEQKRLTVVAADRAVRVRAYGEQQRERVALIASRTRLRGVTREYLQGEVDPILQPDDPLLSIPVTEGSGVGDLASDHDRYLYRKDW